MTNDKDQLKESNRVGHERQSAEGNDLHASQCVACHNCSCESCRNDVRCNLECTNWLADIPGEATDFDVIEVHFKNTRKGFYRNSAHIPLKVGDLVAVEASPGHDIGRVSMMGRLVKLQMKKANLKPDFEILRVFRKAKPSDLERWEEAKAKEVDTMIRSRKIAADLNLKMKIGDVEYQGDGNKAIFYYIADERVDFRQLIKVLADVFKIRVEMKQIGARQEAGRIGGIGPCGRPLCCASWMSSFVSVSTSAARYQDISLNPQKLAGQCAKLKCCINFEVDEYVEALKQMPPRDVKLETKDHLYYPFKTDIFKREVTFSTEKSGPANLVTIPVERIFEVMELNKKGEKPDALSADGSVSRVERKAFGDILGQDAINRFDKKKKKRKSKTARVGKTEGESPKPAHQQAQAGGNQRQRGQRPGGAQQARARQGGRPNGDSQQRRQQGSRQGNSKNNDAPKPQQQNQDQKQ